MRTKTLVVSGLIFICPTLSASDKGDWFVRPYIGYSNLSDTEGVASNVDGINGPADISVDGGFTAGLGVGYQFTQRVSAELAWEYRSNDSETNLDGQSLFTEGNYASSVFLANLFYDLAPRGNWQPYLGAGISWVQEIDIDLERNGIEQSYSGDGDIGYQLFAGTRYTLSKDWEIHGEVRYGSITGIDLEGENIPGQITDLDYKTTTLQIGFNYRF